MLDNLRVGPRRGLRVAAAGVLIAMSCAVAHAQAEPPAGRVTLGEDGAVQRDGVAFRAIGVNYFDAFYRVLKDPSDISYNAGFAALAERGIPFCRFMACGFWPVDWNLYFADKEAYFAKLDAVVASAEMHGIGLVPSLFWAYYTVPDLVGEPCNRLGDPNSATIAFIKQYTEEVVSRYKDSPAIWAWELGNEYSLAIDLPNASEHRPPTWTNLGCPATRSEEDELTHAMVTVAAQAFAEAVRLHDPHRPITPGHSMPRPSQYHQRTEGTWGQDTRAQYQTSIVDLTPDANDLASIHYYPESAANRFGEGAPPTITELLELAHTAVRAQNKALFLGEFGISAQAYGGDATQIEAAFRTALGAVRQSPVDLAAVWVYDFSGQDDDWNIHPDNARGWMLEAVGRANDTDGDGLSNYDEVTNALGSVTDPWNPDTDGDGLTDHEEIHAYGTNPTREDTDGDGLSDYDEIHVYGTDPRNPDTDGDGAEDGWEVRRGSDPLDPESVPPVPAAAAGAAALTIGALAWAGMRRLARKR